VINTVILCYLSVKERSIRSTVQPSEGASLRTPKQPSRPGAHVLDDWLTELPQEHGRVFKKYANDFETAYLVLSISLDEAVGLHKSGRLGDCYAAVGIIPALSIGLAKLIDEMLCNIAQRCMRDRISPSVAPLNPEDFLGHWSRRAAMTQSIQHSLLLKRGLQFRYKIRKLRSINKRLAGDFSQVAGTLSSESVLADVQELWTRMSTLHFDINTCMREVIVMLKCFLHMLPENTLREFDESLADRRTKSSSAVSIAAKSAAG
jgi:hypothetical protein